MPTKSIRLVNIFLIVLAFTFQCMAQEDSVPNELVGRWCYVNLDAGNTAISNSCFTLNQDGTFEAILDRSTLPNGTTFAGSDNDSGTWWVKGKLLHYNSTANGRGSFSLQKMNHPRQENTPMIVLNGIPFAADSPRNPW